MVLFRVKTGKNTAEYIDAIMSRITLPVLFSWLLVAICLLLPVFLEFKLNSPNSSVGYIF